METCAVCRVAVEGRTARTLTGFWLCRKCESTAPPRTLAILAGRVIRYGYAGKKPVHIP